MTEPASQERLAELAANLAAVRASIADACAGAGRDPAEVALIAVTKTFPVPDIIALAGLGVTDVGENKDQEAAPKVAACAAAGLALRWHFVGQLQVNKVASVARYAYMVQSVDRARLVTALGRRASEAGRVIRCLIQVSLDADAGAGAGSGGEAGRGGAPPGEVLGLAAQIAGADGLELAGVMAVAPLGQPARPAYARLKEIADAVRSGYPQAQVISAGMSGDLREAIAEGATHVRIGTALLGGRRAFLR
ncbi:MAG TPA: YggS family pyridoxal phosphate-dependent enzyme [Streptosporangiaceae bacterium]|jgi:pyridoxal phosphate enzyme (YggS family)|nr:YggS family pyridoxal phosphate-dependent enzyme [Streptosporangiaceae bacterium]